MDTDWILEDMGRFWRHITGDSQLRWIGPDKGAIHLATAAIVNAVWDLLAKQAGKPVWQFIGEMSPEEILRLIDFRYLSDAISKDEALEILQNAESGKEARIQNLKERWLPLLHHLKRLARLSRRQTQVPVPRGEIQRFSVCQIQGGQRP